MTIHCTDYGGEEFEDTSLQVDSVSQDALEYIFATDGCDGRGRIIYDYFAASEPDKSTRRLEGDIEEVDE